MRINKIMLSLAGLCLLSISALAHAGQPAKKSANPSVIIKTNKGAIEVVLYQDKAPISVKNFLQYAKDKAYDGTIFHRVMPNFMIQGGGFDIDMKQKATRDAIKNEADNGENNRRGTFAMARTADVNSATAQFFINLGDNDFLNHGGRDFGYAVFAEVTDGMDVIDVIAAVATGNKGGHGDVPLVFVVFSVWRVVLRAGSDVAAVGGRR